jgi:hypothetical protein
MHTRTHEKKSAATPSKFWIVVVERADDVARRDPDLAHVYVSITIAEPGPRLDSVWERRRTKSPGVWGPIRYDLMDRRSFDDRAAADDQRLLTIDRLTRLGHAVNGRSRVYRTYVLELDGSQRPDHRGWLYVGQTSKTFEARLAEHLDATNRLGSAKVRKNFVRARLDLADAQVTFDHEEALMTESRLRVRLEKLGYSVEGGQERYDRALAEE